MSTNDEETLPPEETRAPEDVGGESVDASIDPRVSADAQVASSVHPKGPQLSRVVPFLVLAALGGGLGVAASPPKPGDWIAKELSADVSFLDGNVAKGGALPPNTKEVSARVLERAERELDKPVKVALEGKGQTFSRRELGLRVDADATRWALEEALDPRSARWRNRAGLASMQIAPRWRLDSMSTFNALVRLKEEFDLEEEDAIVDVKAKRVTPPKDGRELLLLESYAHVEKALLEGAAEVALVTKVRHPKRSLEDVEKVEAAEVVGYFQTHYTQGQDHLDRVFNLKRAASKVDGTVLFPGDTFDFNEVVGPRTEGNGFRVATMISRGELVDGLGGGTCQIAGTLHAAAFFAGLEIVERHPHTRPSFYIKMGLDATVAYPTITLRLKNTLPYPVIFRETVEDGWVRAEVLGPKRLGDVTFIRKVVAARAFKERELKDANLAKGEKVLYQRGIPGFRVVRYRVINDGAHVRREKFEDAYPSTAQIWKIGTRDDEAEDSKIKDPKLLAEEKKKRASKFPRTVYGKTSRSMLDSEEPEVKADKHPEYVADEFLEIRQGVGVPYAYDDETKKGGGTQETKVAGKYGSYGWTEREGFAKSVDPKREE